MVSLTIGLARFWLAIRTAWRDPSFRLLAGLTVSLLVVGTWVFHKVEGWTYLDSFYFSAISVATVGYGDFTPKTSLGKLLAVFYIYAGFGLLVAMLTLFANSLIQSVRESREKLHQQLKEALETKAPSGVAQAETIEPPVAQDDQNP
jgi:voltage-gated potassium channel